jgi:hypothetical protein
MIGELSTRGDGSIAVFVVVSMAQMTKISIEEKMRASTGRQRRLRRVAAASVIFLCLAQAPSARADSASCIAKVSSYVAELDQLLSKERNWITPYNDLNEKYFPFRDCEVDALLDAVRKSNFIRSISYMPRTTEYLIHFSSDDVLVGFTYNVSKKKAGPDIYTAGWVHK